MTGQVPAAEPTGATIWGACVTPVKRCPETRAHYAHEWYDPALRKQCPGGPDEGDRDE